MKKNKLRIQWISKKGWAKAHAITGLSRTTLCGLVRSFSHIPELIRIPINMRECKNCKKIMLKKYGYPSFYSIALHFDKKKLPETKDYVNDRWYPYEIRKGIGNNINGQT